MASLESRLLQAERTARVAQMRADPSQRRRAAESRVLDGTAEPEDYAACFTEEVEIAREMYIASAPLYLAAVTAGLHVSSWLSLIAYPPDADLATDTLEHLDLLATVATSTDHQRRAMASKALFLAEAFSIEKRTQAAFWRLVLGDRDGRALRLRAWTAQGDRWVLDPQVLAAATCEGIDLEDLDAFFNGCPIWMPAPSVATARAQEQVCQDPGEDSLWIPFAALAAAITDSGVTDRWVSETWSDQVRTGQEAS
jgi:hypothetical protein